MHSTVTVLFSYVVQYTVTVLFSYVVQYTVIVLFSSGCSSFQFCCKYSSVLLSPVILYTVTVLLAVLFSCVGSFVHTAVTVLSRELRQSLADNVF